MSRTEHVTSQDGTRIAFERTGSGPPLILVDGALCSRAFGPSEKLAPLLARRFTVVAYDRRGRGESTDTAPYARERELEDLAALVDAVGGTAALLGLSSGGALALEAAAAGLPVTKVVAYEPPYVAVDGKPHAGHEAALRRLLAGGKRGDAVRYFMHDMVGAPRFVTIMMRGMPWVWKKLEAAATTLPYDAAIMGDFSVPTERLRAVKVPTLVMHGGKTDARLKKAAHVVAQAVLGAQERVLEGQSHNVSPDVLTPAVTTFLA